MNLKKYPIAAALFFFALHLAFGQTAEVSGNIATWCGVNVAGVTVTATDASGVVAETVTDENGNYSLTLEQGGDYTITPTRNDNPWNGLDFGDLLLIREYIFGLNQFNTYQLIAADVNQSNTVSTFDLVTLGRLMMFEDTAFVSGPSWRFVEAGFVFPNPNNPFGTGFPTFTSLTNLTGDISDVDFTAIKMGDVNCSASGQSYTDFGVLQGQVFRDGDADCTFDVGEQPLENWTITATGDTASYVAQIFPDGRYFLFLPTGNYDLEATPNNQLWAACDGYEDVDISFPSSDFNFGASLIGDCEWMTVDLGTPFLRRCFDNQYVVSYCNLGTQDAIGAEIVITLDPFFEDVESSLPWSNVDGNTYTFLLGDVAAGECGSFTIDFLLSCDAELDQTHCTSAHIFPDTTCLPVAPMWSGADLEITGECDGDEVIFTITNLGEDMTEPVGYVVIEDVMIQMEGWTDILLSGESQVLPTPPITANGATWRVMVDESPEHPFDLLNTVAVEGCGGLTLGLVTAFAQGDEEHYFDRDCRQNVGSWDPNDKQGFPTGLFEEHLIERGQDIEYLIRFQNTGTDTAFNVAVFDTLDIDLDWSSVRLGSSSHPYTFNLYGEGVMAFQFNNIMLPDSNVNEAASHGFVKFKISQRPGLNLGTRIENGAAIYFDFNEPVITNRTLHTLGEQFLEVASQEVFVPGAALTVFPNPFDSFATFRLDGIELQEGTFQLFDQQGRLVRLENFTGNQLRFDGSHLPAGLYFFKIENGGAAVAAGKVLIK